MAGISGYGTTLSGATTGSVGSMLNITGPSETVDDIDVTSMSSTNSRREFISGLIDSGELTFDLIYVKTMYDTIQGDMGTAQVWTMTLDDGTVVTITGYLKGNNLGIPHDDKVTQNCTLKFTGAILVTPSIT